MALKKHKGLYVRGQNKSGEPNQVNLVHKGVKQQANVIYLRKRLRLLVPVNMPRLRLLNAEQLEEINKYLNSPKRLQAKREAFALTHRMDND